ncbi:MAG: hypothetical protein SVT52_01345, partial [Planctomycetota bacterium]|nr:hypothetical protein [Planctomycetota bacterium]
FAMSYTYAAAGFAGGQTYNTQTPLPTYRLMFDYGVIWWQPPHGGAGGNCLLVDNNIKWIPAEDWPGDYYPALEP